MFSVIGIMAVIGVYHVQVVRAVQTQEQLAGGGG